MSDAEFGNLPPSTLDSATTRWVNKELLPATTDIHSKFCSPRSKAPDRPLQLLNCFLGLALAPGRYDLLLTTPRWILGFSLPPRFVSLLIRTSLRLSYRRIPLTYLVFPHQASFLKVYALLNPVSLTRFEFGRIRVPQSWLRRTMMDDPTWIALGSNNHVSCPPNLEAPARHSKSCRGLSSHPELRKLHLHFLHL